MRASDFLFQLPGQGCPKPGFRLHFSAASPPARASSPPGSPAGRRPPTGPRPAAPLQGRAWPARRLAEPSRPAPLPSARCHLNSPVDSWAEAERAFAKGEGGGRRVRAPLPGGAAPAGRAVARSPPAKPLARRSHPTRGCSGGLRGLARGRASTGARASGCVLPGPHLSPPSRGWTPPSITITPPLSLHSWCCIWGLCQPRWPMPWSKERARKARSQIGRTHRPPPSAALQQFAHSRRSPPRPHLFAYPTIVTNQDSSLSKRMALAREEREWLAAHAPRWQTWTEAFIAVVYFHPLPSCSLSLSLFLFFRPSWGSAGGEEEKETEDCIYLLRSWYLLSERPAIRLHIFQSCKKITKCLSWQFLF